MKKIHAYASEAMANALEFIGTDEVQSPERLHQFRLALKRLRFLARLIRRMRPGDEEARHFEQAIRPIFKSAGRVREFHLFEQLIEPYRMAAPHLVVALTASMEREAAWSEILFEKQLKRADPKDFHRFEKEIKKLDKKWSEEKLSGKVRELVRETMTGWPLSHDTLARTDWHELRREMKWVLAVMPLMNEGDRFSRPLKDILKHGAELVGEWHDLYQCLAWVRANRPTEGIPGHELEELTGPMEQGLRSRAAQFEMAYASLIEQIEFNAFLN